MKTKIILVCVVLLSSAFIIKTEVQNYEGSNYNTVKIGSQTWMSKNLQVTSFNNGDNIFQAKTKEDWLEAGKNKTPAWCYYENNANNKSEYGLLYNWYAVNDQRGIAPNGFKIPSKDDWLVLHKFLGTNYAPKLRADGNKWNDTPSFQSKNNSDDFGFNALGSGMVNGKIGWFGKNNTAYWWTSTGYSNEKAVYVVLASGSKNLGIGALDHYNQNEKSDEALSKNYGFAVRCIKNNNE